MTIFPTNFHQNDARHHYPPNPQSGKQPASLDPSPILDLLQADPQQYQQLLSRLLIDPRRQRKNYAVPESEQAEVAGEPDPRTPLVQNPTSSVPSDGWSSAMPYSSTAVASSPQAPHEFDNGSYGHAQQNRHTQQHQSSTPVKSKGMRHSLMQYIVAGGCILSALALMTDVQSLIPTASVSNFCQRVVKTEALLSREHLAQLLTVSERSPKASVQQVIAEPYCQLPPLELRAGVPAEREAYPLAFDPDTWFVVLYENGEYAGFDFSFRK